MKTMWKKAIRVICAGGLSVLCLAGCGKDAAGSPEISTQEIQQNSVADNTQANHAADDGTQTNHNAVDDGTQTNHNAADEDALGSMGNGAFLYGANLYGDVVAFSDEGFSLSPAMTEKVEGGGEVMEQVAPGSESDEDNIQITYTDNTVFQIVILSWSSQSEVSREDTDKESIKKQSSVCVFGSCQDTYHWTADKILILRWQ
nr:hypothetical protein [uncultured Acetatifactor sp.]